MVIFAAFYVLLNVNVYLCGIIFAEYTLNTNNKNEYEL